MASLREKNDCIHRSTCRFLNDQMCFTECGHYFSEENLHSYNSDYTAALSATISEFLKKIDRPIGPLMLFELATRLNSVVKAQQNCA